MSHKLDLVPQRWITKLVALSIFFSPIWFYSFFLTGSRNKAAFPIVTFLIVAGNIALIRWLTRHSSSLRSILQTGYFFRILAVGAYLIVLLKVYGIGDALLYYQHGAAQADQFWRYGDLPDYSGAGAAFVSYLTAWLFLILGSSFVPGMLAFASAAFWGSVFFLEAFHQAFPERKLTAAVLLLFFLPSPVFWTASIGKDALMFFLSGLFCLAYVRLLHGFRLTMLALLLATLWLASMIRPHIALMLAVSALATILLSRGLPGLSRRVSRTVGFALLVAAIVVLLPRVEGFLQLESLSLASSREFLEWQLSVTTRGGSSFGSTTSFLNRLLSSPFILIRPFPWEVHNLTSLIASVESAALLIFAGVNRRYVLANLRRARHQPILIFGLIMTVMFLFAFSSIGNFGIVSRQRVMLLPWLFVFFTPTQRQTESQIETQSAGRSLRLQPRTPTPQQTGVSPV